MHEALSEALRHSLGVEEARRRVRDLAILKMTKLLAELRARSRDEIYYERAHSARLELWVHTMLASFSRGAKRVAFAGDKASACASLVNAAGDSSLGSESARIRRLGAAALVNMCSLVDSHEDV